jgi:hypothetical protein
MPTGRALHYVRYIYKDLIAGVTLEPPTEAHRAYIAAENGIVRWAYSTDEKIESTIGIGMPLEPGYHEEFDTDLQYLQLWAGAQDAIAHVYYFRSA